MRGVESGRGYIASNHDISMVRQIDLGHLKMSRLVFEFRSVVDKLMRM